MKKPLLLIIIVCFYSLGNGQDRSDCLHPDRSGLMDTIGSLPILRPDSNSIPCLSDSSLSEKPGTDSIGNPRDSITESRPESPEPFRLIIRAVGDVMPGSDFMDDLPRADFSHLRPFLTHNNPDMVMGNLEGAMTTHPECRKKPYKGRIYAFRIPPGYAAELKTAGFTLFSLANNHALDFGNPGLIETHDRLNRQGILTIGEKNQIESVTIRGKRIALIGISWLSYHTSFYYQPEKALDLIRQADSTADIVILSIHGGAEGESVMEIPDSNEMMLTEPRGNLYRFCHSAVEAGADLILGHGPHVVRGMKRIQDRLVAFSLGNFLTHGTFNTTGQNRNTLILEAELDSVGRFMRGQIIPMQQGTYGTIKGVPYPDSSGTTIGLIRELTAGIPSSGLQINDEGSVLPDPRPQDSIILR
ncbi:MAG: CapA family protein [Candidatus Delongbacteria bacterium]|nr:CapA family protein [Candidatus Delongbacteria bacterium]